MALLGRGDQSELGLLTAVKLTHRGHYNFDIPVGIAREEHDGVVHTDYTILTTARDPQALKYYWKTYDDQTIRSVDLNALDPNAKAILRVSTSGQQPVGDLTKAMK